MGKAPADQFYWGDWLNDVELQAASTISRGVWINALCRMWYANIKGELTGSKEKLAQICNCKDCEFDVFWKEAKTLGFCYISQDSNGYLTLRNRRMHRNEKAKQSNRIRQQRYYEKHKDDVSPNDELTPPSSSSSSSSKKKTYIDTSIEVQLSTLLLDLIKERKPDFKKPDLQKWAIHIDRMIRIDKRKPDIITNVIEWAQADTDFWQNNILSTEKLRKQFDQLEMKMNQDSDIKTVENTEKAKPLCVKCKKVPAAYEHDKIGWLCRDCWPKGGGK